MDDGIETLAQVIGTRVRTERRAADWTLDQLAAEAGLSRRMVVSVEQGAVNPSLGTLLRLSNALGVALSGLVEEPAPGPVTVTRSGQGAVLWRGDHGGAGVLVASHQMPDVFELWDWRLEPGEVLESDPHPAGTRELLQVIEGAVVLESAGERHELAAGDALAFPGDAPHSYGNRGEGSARFSLSVFEPRQPGGRRPENAHG